MRLGSLDIKDEVWKFFIGIITYSEGYFEYKEFWVRDVDWNNKDLQDYQYYSLLNPVLEVYPKLPEIQMI